MTNGLLYIMVGGGGGIFPSVTSFGPVASWLGQDSGRLAALRTFSIDVYLDVFESLLQ